MADIKVRIVAVDEASGPLDKAGKKAKETASAMQSMGSSIASVAAGMGLQTGVTAFVGALKNAVVGSFELADALEQSQIAFTTMLGSGELATKMLEDLKAFADKTPFEFQDIQSAAKRLMAMGFAAEDVIPTLRSVGDAAAGLGGGKATIDGITLALGQMNAKGKISTQELNQLTERGIPGMKYLAQAAGVTTGEMAKMVEKGLIPANQGVKVLLSNMQKDFGGLMGKQAETASGKLSTMKDAVAGLGTEIGQSLVPAVKDGATFITLLTASLTEYLRVRNQSLGIEEKLQDAAAKGIITYDELRTVLRSTTGEVLAGSPIVKDMAGALLLVEEATRRATEKYKDHNDRTAMMRDLFTQTAEEAGPLKLKLEELATATEMHKDALTLVKGAQENYRKEHESNATAMQKAKEKIALLTEAHKKNQAAILAGGGTIVNNTDAIERANIAAGRASLSLDALNERYANKDNIDNYNQSVSDVGEQQNELNIALANGSIDQKKFDDATGKLNERLGDYKKRLDDSQMSSTEYDLALRDAALDTKENTAKLEELTSQHGKGFTAVQLAAGEQVKYNQKLKDAQTELQKTIDKETELRNYVATAIKETIIEKQIASLAEDGLNEEEIARIRLRMEAFNIASSEKLNTMLVEEGAAAAFAKLEATRALDFITDATKREKAHAAFVESVAKDIQMGLVPNYAKALEAANKANGAIDHTASVYHGLNSKEITLTIITRQIKHGEGKDALDTQPMTAAQTAASTAQVGTSHGPSTPVGAFAAPNPRATGGAIYGNGFSRATGGAMGMEGAYLVGEQGPELFDPSGSGRVFSHNMLKQLGASNSSGGNLRIGTLNVYGVQTASQLYDAITAEARSRGLTFGMN